MDQPVQINSEIGRLKTVVLHRPGKELDNIVPGEISGVPFDDLPDSRCSQQEHDQIADILRGRSVEVLYLDQLIAESLGTDDAREQFVDIVVNASKQGARRATETLKTFLLDLPTHAMVRQIISGVRKDEILLPAEHYQQLHDMIEKNRYPFYLDPMPGACFIGDSMSAISTGVAIGKMKQPIRRRESLLAQHVVDNHPQFTEAKTPVWCQYNQKFSLEGGDIMVLSPDSILVGVSEKTTAEAVEQLAITLFEQAGFKRAVVVELPKTREYSHLNSVISMVDTNKFLVHPGIRDNKGNIKTFILEKTDSQLFPKITEEVDFEHVLRVSLGVPSVELIEVGDGDNVLAMREQWSGGAGVLTIAPGVVIAYERNKATNRALEKAGVEVIEVVGSELLRGHGGVRSLAAPLVRQ